MKIVVGGVEFDLPQQIAREIVEKVLTTSVAVFQCGMDTHACRDMMNNEQFQEHIPEAIQAEVFANIASEYGLS